MITNVLQYLEDSAVAAPGKTAFSDENCFLTYGQLAHKSKALGCKLSGKLSFAINKPIYVHLSRTVADVIAFLGVLYSGNFYVPFDPLTPISRAESMRRVISPTLELTSEQALCASQGSIDHNLLERIRQKTVSSDPVYCMFTSGSTGVPKGVVIRRLLSFFQVLRLQRDIIIASLPVYGIRLFYSPIVKQLVRFNSFSSFGVIGRRSVNMLLEMGSLDTSTFLAMF